MKIEIICTEILNIKPKNGGQVTKLSDCDNCRARIYAWLADLRNCALTTCKLGAQDIALTTVRIHFTILSHCSCHIAPQAVS